MYEVIVGNIGSVYQGGNRKEARKHFNEYVEQSESGVGRAGGESVTMLKDDEPYLEFYGANDVEGLDDPEEDEEEDDEDEAEEY